VAGIFEPAQLRAGDAARRGGVPGRGFGAMATLDFPSSVAWRPARRARTTVRRIASAWPPLECRVRGLPRVERHNRRHGPLGGEIDHALLVDGLEAENERGVIDFAFGCTQFPQRSRQCKSGCIRFRLDVHVGTAVQHPTPRRGRRGLSNRHKIMGSKAWTRAVRWTDDFFHPEAIGHIITARFADSPTIAYGCWPFAQATSITPAGDATQPTR